jgi:4-amino-4-deoxy-L-arabinose transferase-like glycosyltransferase
MESTTTGRISGGDAAHFVAQTLTTSPKPALTHRRLVKLAIVLSLLGLCFQGARGIWEPDEGRYVAIAMNMLSSGDYLVPRLDAHHEHFAKPPLTYWAIAASLAVFGHTEFAARLPSAVAFTMTGFLVAMLAATIRLRRPLLATLIWSTMLLPFLAASVMTTDMLLTFFETLAVLGYLRWRCEASKRGLWMMWIAFGAAFMTKGPPALLPLLAILAFQFRFRRDAPMRALFRVRPVVCCLCIALTWIALILAREPSLWHYFLVHETFDRIATDVHGRNPGWLGLFRVYVPTLVIGTLPFGPLLAWMLWQRRRAPAVFRESPRPSAIKLFLGLWTALPFAVFAVSQSRLPLYLLPLTVPFALMAALLFEEAAFSTRIIQAVSALSALMLLALRLSTAHWHTLQDSRGLATALRAEVNLSRYDEILVVDGHPAELGLEFYTGKPIEATYSGHPQSSGEHPERLCDELKRDARPLLLVPAGQSARYTAEANRCGHARFVGLGRAGQFDLLGASAGSVRALHMDPARFTDISSNSMAACTPGRSAIRACSVPNASGTAIPNFDAHRSITNR